MINFLMNGELDVDRHPGWDSVKKHAESGNPFYVDIISPSKEDIAWLKKIFDFHPLNLEDCTFFSENPKLEEHKKYIFTVVHSVVFDEEKGSYDSFDVHIFLGEKFIVTVHDRELEDINSACDRLSSGIEKKSLSCEYAYYVVLDSVVDSYFPVLNNLSDKLDGIEEFIYDAAPPGDDFVAQLIMLRKGIRAFKRIIVPQRDIIYKISHSSIDYIGEGIRVYLKDVFDHIVKAYDMVDEYRDIISNLADAYYSKNSARLNVIMQKLTIISTIFMPLTFIAGIYGMNFKHMPETEWQYGYYIVLAVMLAAGLGLLAYFKKQKWF